MTKRQKDGEQGRGGVKVLTALTFYYHLSLGRMTLFKVMILETLKMLWVGRVE
jgi:hypothetical protein